MSDTLLESVPERYRGVWVRRLLQTPQGRDTTTAVHWLQTQRWHADLRIPAGPRVAATLLGFSGITTVHMEGGHEVCQWHRQVDLQPPGLFPDVGRMVFETPDRVIETGVHGDYLEVWERLPGSAGFSATHERGALRCLVAGAYAMRVRPRCAAWPADVQAGDTLAEVLERHPAEAEALLDFEISFGPLHQGLWTITHSTLPALQGQRVDWEALLERPAGGPASSA